MDIAAFIIELLARQGILIVPGLGTFIKTRIDGYYSKDHQQFYPPAQQIQFKSEYTDDSVLANLIAKQRQISVASAKYFIEKFVNHIKDQAEVGTAPFGNVGLFSTRRGNLIFTPNELNENDELFYGLAPVKLKRNNAFKQQPVIITPSKPVEPPPSIEPEIVPVPVEEPVIAQPEADEVYEEEEEETVDRTVNIWLVLALIIVLAGIGVIGAYEYKPGIFEKFKPMLQHFKHKQPAATKLSPDDSLKQLLQRQKDIGLASNAPAKAASSVADVDTFRIVVSQFKTLTKATSQSEIYIKKGFDAEIHKPDNSKFYQVTVGTYTNNDSLKAALPLFKQKLNTDIQVQTYPFKKQ